MLIQYSIIIPVFNAEKSLEATLRSVFLALPENSEVIVVDDASTDQSKEIASQFATRIIEHPTNRGPSAARNSGVEAANGDLFIFIDADVELTPDSLKNLCQRLHHSPELLGVNGTVSLQTPNQDSISVYVNSSLYFQLQRHGTLVNTCFTSLCLLKREAWELMNGWDEDQYGRYVDDVNTRWFFPDHSIAQEASAQFLHHKKVGLLGLLKHRTNIGYHFIRNLKKQSSVHSNVASRSVIHHRYPINTILAVLFLPILLFPNGWVIWLLGLTLNNLQFWFFILRNHGILKSLMVFPLSLLEGMTYAIGMSKGIIDELF